jgi:uncharacterized protein (DUF1919 family)
MSLLLKIRKAYKNSLFFKQVDKCQNKQFQRRLTNHGFTLLTPNCMAGMIYHRLGERFNSPTIDVSIPTHDFMLMVSDLDYYMSQDVEEAESDLPYPVGIIRGDKEHGDVRINFVHYADFESARNKWNERKTRIVPDNTYIIVCDIDDIYTENADEAGFISDEDLKLFESVQCSGRAMLTRDKARSQPYAYYAEPYYNGVYPLTYLNRYPTGLNAFEKKFDFVSFINCKG